MSITILVFWSAVILASNQLWVVYHPGCPSCDSFLAEIVPEYPKNIFTNYNKFIPLKLLNAELPIHQEIIAGIHPEIYSTPTFLYVQIKNSDITVLSRWLGYKSTKDFYTQLDHAINLKK